MGGIGSDTRPAGEAPASDTVGPAREAGMVVWHRQKSKALVLKLA